MRKRIGRRVSETVCSALALMAAGALPLAGCATAQEAGASAASQGETVAAAATRIGFTGEERVNFILDNMTLAEKLGQLNQVPGGRQKAPNSLVTPEVEQALRD